MAETLMGNPVLPAPATLFVPHRGLMSFLGNLEAAGSEVRTTAPAAGNPMTDIRGGAACLNPLALVEMAAQTCAAWNGYRNREGGGGVKTGFLAGISRFAFNSAVDAGSELTILVREETSLPPVTVVGARILSGERVVAEGELKVWENEGDHPAAAPEPEKDWQGIAPAPGQLTEAILSAGSGFASGVDGYRQDFVFDGDFYGFDGHFPGFPILPGVMILRAAWLTIEKGQDKSLDLHAIKKIKFGRPFLPGEKGMIQATRRSEREWGFELTVPGGKAASGLLELSE
jgi:3-hydroxymyristoyl/3-hydroxydecanoyl-(acyl carrier protein) dehydratase